MKYFMKLIQNMIEGAENARDYEDALKHGGFDVGANDIFWDSTRRVTSPMKQELHYNPWTEAHGMMVRLIALVILTTTTVQCDTSIRTI